MRVQWAGTRWMLALLCCALVGLVQAAGREPPAPLDFDALRLTADARDTRDWALAAADHGNLPFAIVDKKNARLFVFHGDGRLAGQSAALLGQTLGDHAVPGAGARVANLTPDERTTPAGRFRSEPGHNLRGEALVWIDYDAAIAIHRVRPGPAREQREQRLSSATPYDNRVSLGCVVVPVDFYEQVVSPVLGRGPGVVYVLPETQPAMAMLNAYQAGMLKPH